MAFDFGFQSALNYRVEQLKKDVIHVLKRHPEGLRKSEIWTQVYRETGREINARLYGVNKMSRILEQWTDEITVTDLEKDQRVILKSRTGDGVKKKKNPKATEPVAVGLLAEIKRRAEKAGKALPSTSAANDDSEEVVEMSIDEDDEKKIPKAYEADVEIVDEVEYEHVENHYDLLVKNLPVMKLWILEHLRVPRRKGSCKLSSLRSFLKSKLKEEFAISSLKSETLQKLLSEQCQDIVYMEQTQKSLVVFLIETVETETTEKQPEAPTAMSLMSRMFSLNKNQNSSKSESVPTANYISLLDDDKKDKKKSNVIDLTEDRELERPLSQFKTSPLGSLQFGAPASTPQSNSYQASSLPVSRFGAFPVPSNLLKPQHGPPGPITLGDPTHREKIEMDAAQISVTGQFAGIRRDPSLPGFRDQVIDLTVVPVNKTKFEKTTIDVRPVHVPYGRTPSREQVNVVANECIETLTAANESVTMERVEKLVCQRYRCYNIRQLGIQYTDQIPCINELNRLLCKVNLYIIAFVKTRSICTLHELKESLRDYAEGKGDFDSLKLGPLQRFPVVFQQFHFPPDLAEIPEITSMDILDHFHNYMTKYKLWSKKLELEPFMDYLVQEYEADDAYMLGCRIRSLPLAAAVLKKAHRDAGNHHRNIVLHYKDELKNEIGDAFRKFRASILQTSDGEGMEVRQHYMKMRPELAILEIFDKYSVLLMVTQGGDRQTTKVAKFRRQIQEFLQAVRGDDMCKNILHLALCMTNTAVEEAAMELLVPTQADSDDENEQKTSQNKPPPRKDALIESLKTYIERCLNAGAISLTHLDRMEEKILEDFGYSAFSMMGYGRFIEFLLLEMKQMLEESGGLSLGLGTGGSDTDSSFKPHQTDILEFIRQCRQCTLTQPEQIEDALCKQYSVKEVRHLGCGNITRLLSYADKHLRYTHGECTVLYESTLVPSAGLHSSSRSKVGILGHQTRDAAKTCLHNCPLLENMADWSQWSLVFEPELGKLKDFVQKYGGVTTKTLEGGKLATFDFLALELKPGEYIKIVSTTSSEHIVKGLENHDVSATAGHLVSMAVAYNGVESMPLALLSGHMKTALLLMHAEDSSTDTTTGQTASPDQHKAASFVLRCLLHIPTKICVSLANQIFLDPLGQVVGSSKSKQMLAGLSKTVSEQNQLLQLGCLLGIPEWTDMIQQKCKLPDSAIQILPADAEELFLEENPEQEEEEEEMEIFEDDGTEDVDEILAGELCKDKTTETDAKTSDETDQNAEKIEEKDKEDETEGKKGTKEDIMVATETELGVTAEQLQTKLCEDVVNQIRRDEFGVGIQLSEDGQRLMKIQQERLGRSLDRLSKDLYSKDTHFVLELVQNADDNSYHDNLLNNTTDECPSVKFVIEHDGIYVLNNELGFTERDVRALCDVGRSTKGKHKFGYIGQKGIGFKSVFRITDAPEVHSHGYHIRFDVNSGPMGYILPHWVPEEERTSQEEWMTHILLRLKPDMLAQTRTLAARFNDIHPSLLLFLHRLREITIENKVEKSVQTMRRRDVGGNVVEIQHTHGAERWLVIKKMLDARKISLQAKSGADVESTEIALAFPLKQQGQQTSLTAMPPKQPVFAFLPLRSYGFRFIVQGDFDVPSSREDVDRDSPWNQWLRSEIHMAFVDALDVFKTHPEFSSMEAVCSFLQFVPMEDEVLDFFKPVASDILKKLRARPCVPTQPNSQGVVTWKIPSQMVRIRDALVRNVITADLLQTHLNLFYLHSDVAAMLNPALTSSLGIETLTSDHLFQLGKALIVDMGTHCTKEEDIILVAKWMACMYRSLEEFHQEETILTTLKCSRMFPMANGELVALQDRTVFYPIEDTSMTKKRNETMSLIQQDVNSLHPMLLNTGDDEVNSQVQKLLQRLGLKQLSPFDVINHHIIPVMKSDTWQTKSNEMLVAYLVYIKEHTDKQQSVCNLHEVKDIALVKTSQGFKNPSREPVHFPPKYGNPVKLQEKFFGYDWTLLHDCYLPEICSQPMIISWMDFFKKLGVEEFLSIRQTEKHLKREDLATSPWSEQSSQWPKEKLEFVVHDFHCAELEGLITRNRIPAGDKYADQMKYLCTYLDKHWESKFSRYCTTLVHDKNGIPVKETDTSFSILLKTAQWLPATQTETSQRCDGSLSHEYKTVMKEPSCLYIQSEAVEKLLSDKVLYLNMKLNEQSFCQFLGLKKTVSIETVKEYVLTWSQRTAEDSPASFCTSLEHMRNVYNFLGKELKRKEFQDLLREKPVFFVPDKSSNQIYDKSESVAGKMLNRSEIWFSDKTGLFDKYRQILEEFHSDICRKRTLDCFYSDKSELVELFKQEGKLDSQPKVEEYMELLCLLCSTSSPKDAKILSDVLYIYSTIGQALATQPEGMPDEQTANMTLEALKSTVRKTLQKKKVFPTSKHVWVSLDDTPLIDDNRELERMFLDKPGVHFLDMEDQATKIFKVKKGRTKLRKGTLNVLESRIQQEWIDVVVEVCGIKKLSEVVDIRPTPDMIEPCKDLQLYFSKIIPYIQQYLMSRYSDVYQELEHIKTKHMLKEAQFFQAGKLEVSYWLTSMAKDTFVVQEVKCNITPPDFYFHKDHLTAMSEINKEVARYFSSGDSDCNTALRSFLSELWNITCGIREESIEAVLQRHEADGIEVAEDDKWLVEAPLIEIPVQTQTQPEEEEAVEVVVPEAHLDTGAAIKREEPFQMRQWPPVGNYRNTQPGDTKDKSSKGRLPKEAEEYRRSVRDLPTNIRLVDREESSEAVDGAESGTTGDEQSRNKLGESDADTERIEERKRKFSGTDEEYGVKRQSKEGPGVPVHNEGESAGVSDDGRYTRGYRGEGHYRPVDKEGQPDTSRDEEGLHKPIDVEDDSDRPSSKHRQHQDYDDDGYQYQRRRRIRGDPIWSSMATDYTFDELGSGEDLPVPLNLEPGAADLETGRWGEQLVAHYLDKQRELGNIVGYTWSNKEEEAGYPFDFEVQIQDENGGIRKDYIEVKSTQSSDKEVFQISVQQIKFADEKGNGFHIYRVFNAGQSEKVRLIRITDLNMRLSTKQVKLCMMI